MHKILIYNELIGRSAVEKIITNQLLYQLSYISAAPHSNKKFNADKRSMAWQNPSCWHLTDQPCSA